MVENDYDKVAWCLNKNDYATFLRRIREIFLENGYDIWLDRDVDVLVKEVRELLSEAEIRECKVDNVAAENYLVLYWKISAYDWIRDPTEAVMVLDRYITDDHPGNCDYIVIQPDGDISYFCQDLNFIRPYYGFSGIGKKIEEAK